MYLENGSATSLPEFATEPWKAKCEAEQSGAILNADERAELLKLRKEVKELRMEKEILKKASSLLLRETK